MAQQGPGRPFEYRLLAPDSDIDENCHISNVAYVRWIERATRAHSDAIGWDVPRYQGLGCSFVIRRHEIDYLRSARAGDEIKIVTWVDEFRPASAKRASRILRAHDDVELVRAMTEWVWIRLEGTRPSRIPPDVVAAFS